jgi:hypothetical protein
MLEKGFLSQTEQENIIKIPRDQCQREIKGNTYKETKD